MRIFVTGATGWVGSAVVDELIGAGHQVAGLSRSAQKASGLAKSGAEVVQGTLDDLDVLRAAASNAAAVIHTAFDHDFSRFEANAAQDERAIAALGETLKGSDRPLIVTSGLARLATGRPATESDPAPTGFPRKSEIAARTLLDSGVRASVVRLAPSVHGTGDHGFVPRLIDMAREKGVSAYIGEGLNRWTGVHRLDAARLYRLAIEQGATEPVYHAADEEGVAFKEIAAVIGRGLGVPVESRAADHFGWFAGFAGGDMAASSVHTRKVTGWQPRGPGFLADISQPSYYAAQLS